MIGGMVIDCCEFPGCPDVLFVNVADRPYSKLETCGVLVEQSLKGISQNGSRENVALCS